MKTLIKSMIAISTIAAATSFAASVQFHAGQRLTADQLNQISTQASSASEALGLAKDGNALVAQTSADLNQSISNAVTKSEANCHQTVCSTTVYLIPNQTYTVSTSTLTIPANVTITTLGHATATIALNNASLSLGKGINLQNVTLKTSNATTVNKQLKTSAVTQTNVNVTA